MSRTERDQHGSYGYKERCQTKQKLPWQVFTKISLLVSGGKDGEKHDDSHHRKQRATSDEMAKTLNAGWFSRVGLALSALIPLGTVADVAKGNGCNKCGRDGA
ncbi:hypothetical protein L1049_015140 [Liquidambar formosana]|uniref:Uncharacterized protein n=1 Tax=Liquidambar formosana TaxID=63359 RepID=A0AAP0X2B3_LIQFO